MIRRFLMGATLVLASTFTQASLIEYNGYSRDSASNIVTGGGLEWLMWDITKGLSISSALSAYASDGWVLANHTQMTDLFNIFEFGKNDWNSSLDTLQSSQTPWTVDELSIHNQFNSLFGITLEASNCLSPNECYDPMDPRQMASAIYGEMNGSEPMLWRFAQVTDDFTGCIGSGCSNINYSASAMIGRFTNLTTPDEMFSKFRGIALVRQNIATPVRLPGSLSLLILGLLGLINFRKFKVLSNKRMGVIQNVICRIY